jgi:hypothetical protein
MALLKIRRKIKLPQLNRKHKAYHDYQKDAINIGKAIVKALNTELDTNTPLPDVQRWALRGSASCALNNLCYDVIPIKTRRQFAGTDDFFLNKLTGLNNETI